MGLLQIRPERDVNMRLNKNRFRATNKNNEYRRSSLGGGIRNLSCYDTLYAVGFWQKHDCGKA